MKKIIFLLLTVVIFTACHRNKPAEQQTLQTAQNASELYQLFRQSDSLYRIGTPDTVMMHNFVNQAIAYTDSHPEDAVAPQLLMHAGETCIRLAESAQIRLMKVNYAKQALDIFYKVQKVYPDFEDVKMCYFNRGLVYDDILQDYESAKFEYSDYIHKYPNDSLSIHLKTYIQYLGKSPEEIMKATCQK